MSERQRIAGEITRLVATAENSVDQAAANVARLLSALALGRIDAGLSGVVAPKVFVDVSAAAAALAQARERVVSIHGQLEALRKVLKLEPTTNGGSGDKPPGDSFASATASPVPLQRVG